MEMKESREGQLSQLRETVRRFPLFVGAAHQWDHRRRRLLSARETVGAHACEWKVSGLVALPTDERRPHLSTLVLEQCRYCPAMRSEIRDGRWMPSRSGALVPVSDAGSAVPAAAVAG
jgi:hypothetical protein